MLSRCAIFMCLIAVTFARSALPKQHNSIVQDNIDDDVKPRSIPSYLSDMKFLYKTYQDCSSKDLSICLKLKLFTSMDRMVRSLKNVNIFEGVTFVKDESSKIDVDNKSSKPVLSENEIEAALPRSLNDKESAINDLIMDKIVSFFQSHTLQIKLPSNEEMQRSLNEGRKKDKKGAYIMIPLLLGGTFIPIAYGALALLAGKALIVSKLALVLASIIGIKKLLSSTSGHHESSHEVVVSGNGHGGSGWGRSGYNPQDLAYNAHVPRN